MNEIKNAPDGFVDVAVVGGGAAGLMAALAAAVKLRSTQSRARVVILETQPRVGKKLLATGNGRCNLTNKLLKLEHYYGDAKLALPILTQYSPEFLLDYFSQLGLVCHEEEDGRIYPYSHQASSVLDVLRMQLDRFLVETICEFSVCRLTKTKNGFQLENRNGGKISAKCVIITTGGKASPQLGADGSGYQLAKEMGHTVTPLFPALVPLKTQVDRVRLLKGIRCHAIVRFYAKGVLLKKEQGEVQFTEYGLSGICVFQLSRLFKEMEAKGETTMELSMDLLPDYSTEQVCKFLQTRIIQFPNLPWQELFTGLIHKKIGQAVVIEAVKKMQSNLIGTINQSDLAKIAAVTKDFRFPVNGAMPWKNAQVTAGGIPLKELWIPSMESRKVKGLFFAGEILNIDGDCGGFNLHWAWATGLAAGNASAKFLLEEIYD